MKSQLPNWLAALKRFVVDQEFKFWRKNLGGIQECTWCSMPMAASIRQYEEDTGLDELTCSHCKGTSIWLFTGVGFVYVKEGKPPPPKFERMKKYDD